MLSLIHQKLFIVFLHKEKKSEKPKVVAVLYGSPSFPLFFLFKGRKDLFCQDWVSHEHLGFFHAFQDNLLLNPGFPTSQMCQDISFKF